MNSKRFYISETDAKEIAKANSRTVILRWDSGEVAADKYESDLINTLIYYAILAMNGQRFDELQGVMDYAEFLAERYLSKGVNPYLTVYSRLWQIIDNNEKGVKEND